MGCDIGIPIYSGFLSPKLIAQADGTPVYFVYWQTGSWGPFRGGHWMRIAGFSRKIKARPGSAGSVFLPGTWADQASRKLDGGRGFDEMHDLGHGRRYSGNHVQRDRTTGQAATRASRHHPDQPKVGDKVTFAFSAKNVGEGKLTGIQMGIEEKYNEVYPDNFRGPIIDLEPGATASYNPTTAPMVAGSARWIFDNLRPYTRLATIERTIEDNPEPPPPPPPTI